MKAFRFDLQKVLEWREMQLGIAQEKLQVLQRQFAVLQQQEAQVRAFYTEAESRVLASPTMSGAEMQALSGFKRRTLKQLNKIQARQTECAALVGEQRERTVEARRAHRVLEKLRETRHQEWVYLADKELESTAAEVYLANWMRDAGNEPLKRAK